MAIIQLPKSPSPIPAVTPPSGSPTPSITPRVEAIQAPAMAQQLASTQAVAPAGAGAGPAATALTWFIEGLADKVTDPAIIQALGPQSGLTVTPVTFQSIEQEGRWKPNSIVDQSSSASRNFVLAKQLANASPPNNRATALAEPYGTIKQNIATIFTIKTQLGSTVSCDAIWWSDDLEIFAGYCGMAKATGFGSVWNDMASFGFYALPFGNYYPAKILVTWAGWVNPVGPDYWEFKGAVTLSALGSLGLTGGTLGKDNTIQPSPSYCQAWNRSQGQPPVDIKTWSSSTGFNMDLTSMPQVQAAAPQSR